MSAPRSENELRMRTAVGLPSKKPVTAMRGIVAASGLFGLLVLATAVASCAESESAVAPQEPPTTVPEAGSPQTDAAADASPDADCLDAGDGGCTTRELTCAEADFCAVPTGVDLRYALFGVWGSSDKDVWAVGSAGTVIHWDGAAWTGVPLGRKETMRGVGGRSANDVFIVSSLSVVLHSDGFKNGSATFTAEPPLDPIDPTNFMGATLTKVWAAGTGELFVGGPATAGWSPPNSSLAPPSRRRCGRRRVFPLGGSVDVLRGVSVPQRQRHLGDQRQRHLGRRREWRSPPLEGPRRQRRRPRAMEQREDDGHQCRSQRHLGKQRVGRLDRRRWRDNPPLVERRHGALGDRAVADEGEPSGGLGNEPDRRLGRRRCRNDPALGRQDLELRHRDLAARFEAPPLRHLGQWSERRLGRRRSHRAPLHGTEVPEEYEGQFGDDAPTTESPHESPHPVPRAPRIALRHLGDRVLERRRHERRQRRRTARRERARRRAPERGRGRHGPGRRRKARLRCRAAAYVLRRQHLPYGAPSEVLPEGRLERRRRRGLGRWLEGQAAPRSRQRDPSLGRHLLGRAAQGPAAPQCRVGKQSDGHLGRRRQRALPRDGSVVGADHVDQGAERAHRLDLGLERRTTSGPSATRGPGKTPSTGRSSTTGDRARTAATVGRSIRSRRARPRTARSGEQAPRTCGFGGSEFSTCGFTFCERLACIRPAQGS